MPSAILKWTIPPWFTLQEKHKSPGQRRVITIPSCQHLHFLVSGTRKARGTSLVLEAEQEQPPRAEAKVQQHLPPTWTPRDPLQLSYKARDIKSTWIRNKVPSSADERELWHSLFKQFPVQTQICISFLKRFSVLSLSNLQLILGHLTWSAQRSTSIKIKALSTCLELDEELMAGVQALQPASAVGYFISSIPKQSEHGVQTVCWWSKQRGKKALGEQNLGQPAAGSSREWEGGWNYMSTEGHGDCRLVSANWHVHPGRNKSSACQELFIICMWNLDEY